LHRAAAEAEVEEVAVVVAEAEDVVVEVSVDEVPDLITNDR